MHKQNDLPVCIVQYGKNLFYCKALGRNLLIGID